LHQGTIQLDSLVRRLFRLLSGNRVASVCRKKDVFAGEGRPAGLVTGWNTRSIASRRRLISLGMP
jgi:hypothetical protein